MKKLYRLINEQFSISDLDFSDDEQEDNINIFNKHVVEPKQIYTDILNNKDISEDDIMQLNYMVSVIKIKNADSLQKIADYYSEHYPNDSLNWLDVSLITDMSNLFSGTEKEPNMYNGDISKWDVSNVETMEEMFAYSIFDKDISKWNVICVNNMAGMFMCSKFNSDISKWDVSNVRDMQEMFAGSEFNQDISSWDVRLDTWDGIFDDCPIEEIYEPEIKEYTWDYFYTGEDSEEEEEEE